MAWLWWGVREGSGLRSPGEESVLKELLTLWKEFGRGCFGSGYFCEVGTWLALGVHCGRKRGAASPLRG